jgi:hypothetical protein
MIAPDRFDGFFYPVNGGFWDAGFVGNLPDGEAIIQEGLHASAVCIFELPRCPYRLPIADFQLGFKWPGRVSMNAASLL